MKKHVSSALICSFLKFIHKAEIFYIALRFHRSSMLYQNLLSCYNVNFLNIQTSRKIIFWGGAIWYITNYCNICPTCCAKFQYYTYDFRGKIRLNKIHTKLRPVNWILNRKMTKQLSFKISSHFYLKLTFVFGIFMNFFFLFESFGRLPGHY